MGKLKDITNQKFGRLTAVHPTGEKDKNGKTLWYCKCDCGGSKVAPIHLLNNGRIKSCGCLISSEEKSKRATKHGLRNTRLYTIWSHIKDRCYNENSKIYKYYGKKGVQLCEEWRDFINFYNWALSNGYSDELTIDRIDVNGSYDPSNCRWVDYSVQANNRTNNKLFTFNNKTQTLTQWCNEYDIDYNVVKDRIGKLKWSFEDALITPIVFGQKIKKKEDIITCH